jgi:hypothetical protein
MNSHSQCPGEAYNSFWEEENNQPSLNVDKLVEDLHWNGTKWVKTETVYRINYHRNGDLERRWKEFETMHMAISVAHNMIQSGGVAIESITKEQKL